MPAMNQDPVAAGGPVLLGSKHGQKEGKDVARASEVLQEGSV